MNAVRIVRIVTLLEGIVYLALLFVAMPLKYVFLVPAAVRIVGTVHGLLFLVLVSALYRATLERDWPHRTALTILGAGLIPFGFLAVHGKLRQDEARAANDENPV